MVGKKAWEYLQKIKDDVDVAIIVDIEYGYMKAVYHVKVDEIKDTWFKDDDGNWNNKGDYITMLKGVMLKNYYPGVNLTAVDTGWFQSVGHIMVDRNGNLVNTR